MSTKREALLGRFKARSLDRLRQLGHSLDQLEEGKGTPALKKEVARELHTFKGDSRVVGLEALSLLAHDAEEVLLLGSGQELPTSATCARLREALAIAVRVLKDELGKEQAEEALAQGRRALAEYRTSLSAGAPAPSGSPEPTPAAAQAAPITEGVGAAPASTEAEPGDAGPAGDDRQVPAPQQAEAAAPRAPPQEQRWTHVPTQRIDEICERTSDFAAQFNALSLELATLAEAGATASRLRALAEALDRCRVKLEDVTSSAWALRLVPVEPALEDLVGHARELAASQRKRLRVTVRSLGAEVERGVLDALQEPLLHLVRNAVDHGIEAPDARADKGAEGNLALHAASAGPNLIIEVVDDGRGVDLSAVRRKAVALGLYDAAAADRLSERELLDLLFRHGFTTRSKVTAVSGRGVGLDVVRERLETLGGTAEVFTLAGRGTTFKLTVPSTITRERVLVVESAGVLYGLTSATVVEVLRLADHPAERVAGGRALQLRGERVPLRSLGRATGGGEERRPVWGLVVTVGGRLFALEVETLLGEKEILRRPVDALLAPFEHIAASGVLDDGRLVLLLSLPGLMRKQELSQGPTDAPAVARKRTRVLVVDDSLTVVDLVRELLSDAGFEVRTAHDGQAALQVLEGFMPELVLADVDMPVMDGFALLKSIRARWPHLPVVMLTTRGSSEDRRHAASLGASAYLVKSQFEEATLVETVRRFVGAS